ncbi:MAG: DUF3122 domain-containing protein [Leptolyngbyaceae cyanobacterium SM2_5_2]|nr:DUF3122 domain-containing protein [Leptolyngbyaceae cyanobacterium SM2_5_2]
MTRGIAENFWCWLKRLVLALILAIGMLLIMASPALASIHTYHEQPGQTTHRSTQSLRDQNDLAWQATLFKRYSGDELQGIYLRLVGFPGQVTVNPHKDLLIETGTTAQWSAPYQVDGQTKALPDNVVQYNVTAILDQLQRPIPLTLVVPVAGSQSRLVVAPYVVEEWLQIYRMGVG